MSSSGSGSFAFAAGFAAAAGAAAAAAAGAAPPPPPPPPPPTLANLAWPSAMRVSSFLPLSSSITWMRAGFVVMVRLV